MELEISNKMANEKGENNEATKFMQELEETKEKLEIADKNLAMELCKKFKLPSDCAEELEKKIEKYLEKYSRSNDVMYIGYDLKTNSYYQDQYKWYGKDRINITKERAEDLGIGSFYEVTFNGPEADATINIENIDYVIRRAIETSIKEQLQEGIDIKDIDLFKLKDDYKNCSFISKIYEEDEPKRERPEWAKQNNVYL